MKHTAGRLKPWARGPFELLRHADEHLRANGDTDRRIALMGFDQTVEVCIEVYLRLYPRLRDGIEIKREDVDKALRSFHTKIEFLEQHFTERKIDLGVSVEAIVWFHSLRNELYHSGNGMVPELHVLEGAREAAIRVFSAVFGTDALENLRPSPAADPEQAMRTAPRGVDSRMDFLQTYVLLEDVLAEAIHNEGETLPEPLNLRHLWNSFERLHPEVASRRDVINQLRERRNRLVHEPVTTGSELDFNAAMAQIWSITAEIEQLQRSRTPSVRGRKPSSYSSADFPKRNDPSSSGPE